MKFRRRFPARRRRRRLPETYTLKHCRECINVYGSMSCSNPVVDIFEILSMSTQRGLGNTTEISNPTSKAIIFDGMKFQSLWLHDPQTTLSCFSPNPDNPNPDSLAFILTIWEAIMLLPLAQNTTNTPAYLPVLSSPTSQSGDTADRVLWKRLTHLYIQGVASLAGAGFAFVLNPDSSARYNTESPVHVKSKCRIDDRHALYYVRNLVHDVFLPFAPHQPCGVLNCEGCEDNTSALCGSIPVVNDFWSKVYYHAR